MCWRREKSGGITRQEDDIKKSKAVPAIAFDYVKQKSKEVGEEEKKERKDRGKRITRRRKRRTKTGVKWISANVVPKKGVEGDVVHAVGREIDQTGVRRMVIKSDQEPALKEFLRAAKAERPE